MDKFKEKSKNIVYKSLNIPLIKSTERVRLNLNNSHMIKYDKCMCEQITQYKNIIIKLENLLKDVEIDDKKMNIQIYLLLLGLVIVDDDSKSIWLNNFFIQMSDSVNKVEKTKLINGNILFQSSNSQIEKLNLSIKVKIIEKNEFIISNLFEKIIFNGNNYVIDNLVNDYSPNINAPSSRYNFKKR